MKVRVIGTPAALNADVLFVNVQVRVDADVAIVGVLPHDDNRAGIPDKL